MQNIKGYVCVAALDDRQILFGQSVEDISRPGENITGNNLTLYSTRDSARKGKKGLQDREMFSSVRIARLELEIAESVPEIESLKDKTSLVGLLYTDHNGIAIFGPRSDDTSSSDVPLGMTIQQNGLMPFTDYVQAYWVNSENARKALSRGTLALYKLEFIR
jgi:hypothetical protein